MRDTTDGERKDTAHITNANNNGLVTRSRAQHDLKPLKRCACGTVTKDDKCSWCVIRERVGYDFSDCR